MNLKRKEGRMSKELTTSWGEKKNLRARCLHLPPTRNRLYYIQEASHLTYKNKTHVLKKDTRQQKLLEDIFFSDNFASASLEVQAPTNRLYNRVSWYLFRLCDYKLYHYSKVNWIVYLISKFKHVIQRKIVEFGSFHVHLVGVLLKT